jgi:outer membrane protein TolC
VHRLEVPRQSTFLLASSAVVATAALLSGCASIKPRPISHQDILTSSKAVAQKTRQEVEPITQALTLEEALARAFKYNLAQRAHLIEQAVALNVWKAGNFDMLPRAMAMAGYHHRNKELITRSRDSVTGLPSLANPYISSERESATYDLGVSWSILDFAVGYYNAKQHADRVLIAAEHRRKAMHALAREVTIAFWRMASAQRLLSDVRTTLAAAESALGDASAANAEGLRSPVDNLRYQRQLLENIRLLSSIGKEFEMARLSLAQLINAPAQSTFGVVEPSTESNIRILDIPAEHMEEVALSRNAELKEHVYNQRIAAHEARKTLAKLVPNLSLSYSLKHNNDSYLINNSWAEAGALVSQNFTTLLSYPAQKRMAQGGIELAAQRRAAAQVALVTQVHLARIELASAYRQLGLADRIWTLDQGIKQATANRQEAQAESKLNRVAADTAYIVSMLKRYQALAEFNAAAGALQSTLGMEISTGSVSDLSLQQLTAEIARWQQDWREGRISRSASDETAQSGAATSATERPVS